MKVKGGGKRKEGKGEGGRGKGEGGSSSSKSPSKRKAKGKHKRMRLSLLTDSSPSQIHSGGTAKPTGTDNENRCIRKLELTCDVLAWERREGG